MFFFINLHDQNHKRTITLIERQISKQLARTSYVENFIKRMGSINQLKAVERQRLEQHAREYYDKGSAL